MKSNCDKMKEQIADFITGILPEAEIHALKRHLSECPVCRDYAEALEKEERLLSGFFAKFDDNITGWEDKAIDLVNSFDASSQTNVISAGKAIMRSLLIKHAAAAMVIVFVAVYFIITLTWISQISDCIRLSL